MKSGDSIGFYSENKEFLYVNGISTTCSTIKSHLYFVTPSSDNYNAFIIIDTIDSPIHLLLKIFPRDQYKVYSWSSKAFYFDISKEDCKKTIIGIEHVEKNRNENATLDFIKGYGDINIYLSYDVGKNYTFDELINSAKASIFHYIITNRDVNFYNIKCSLDSYLRIESVYAQNDEYYLDNLPMIITYLEKERTLKYIFRVKVNEEFDFIIKVPNINNLEEGDINIISDTKNISMVEKSIYFHHDVGETFFMIENIKNNIILNITLEVNMTFKYIFNDTMGKTKITDKSELHILVKPKIIEPITIYKQIFHNVYTISSITYNYANKIYISQDYIRKYIKHLASNSAKLILDNEIAKNHEKYNSSNPLFFYFYLEYAKNYENGDFTVEYFYSGKADLKRAQFFHSNDSRIEQTLFDIEPKDNDTNMISFFIFACGNLNNPSLILKYGSTNIIDSSIYYGDNYKFFYLNYNLENIKGEGNFKGNFMIFYNLYNKPNFEIKVNNNFQIKVVSYDFFKKIMTINIYPYLFNDEVEYEIYYAKNGEIPPLSRCQAFHWFEQFNQNEYENIHLKIVNFNKSNNNPFEVEFDYSMDKWPSFEISYDFLIYIKQVNYQKNRNIYRTNIKKLVKFDINSLSPFEKIIEPYEEVILLYDGEGKRIDWGDNIFYYLSFDQDISLDSINFICTMTESDSRNVYPDLDGNDCQVFKEPGSSNSFILTFGKINYYYSYYFNTITIQKKKVFDKKLKFKIFISKRADLESKIYSIKVEDNCPLILLNLYNYNAIFRKINGTFDIFYTMKSFNSIDEYTMLKKDKYVLWTNYETIIVIISLKNAKIGENITFEFWRFEEICEKRNPTIKIVKNDISDIIFSDTDIIQMNLYEDEEYKNRVINAKNIFFEKEPTKYYIINEDNIPNNESITMQCFSSKEELLLNDKYIRTNNSYEIIYNSKIGNNLDSIEYFMELKDYDLDYNKEYRFLISKNNFREFSFVNINDIFNITIKQFSKSDLIISTENETYTLGIDNNILKLEHKIGEKTIKFENTGNGEDSYIFIILYSQESDNIKTFDFNSYQKMYKSDYGFIELDKNNKDKILGIFPYNDYRFTLHYTFITLDSEKKYIPNYTFITKSNSLSLSLNQFNYNALLNEENFNLIFNIDSQENMIITFIGDKIYNENVNQIIKTEENQNIFIEFKSKPKAVQVIPCNNEKVNITIYTSTEAISQSNILSNKIYKMDSKYINIYGKSYICSDSKFLSLNSKYNSIFNITDYNITHIKIEFIPIEVRTAYDYYIIQYNSNSIFAKDNCQAFDNFKERNYSQFKEIKHFFYQNSIQYIEKKQLNKNEYINIVVDISDYFYVFYQPIKWQINDDNDANDGNDGNDNVGGESQSLGIILGIIIPITVIILLILGFIGYRYYKKKKNSQNEDLINNIQKMSNMEKELL